MYKSGCTFSDLATFIKKLTSIEKLLHYNRKDEVVVFLNLTADQNRSLTQLQITGVASKLYLLFLHENICEVYPFETPRKGLLMTNIKVQKRVHLKIKEPKHVYIKVNKRIQELIKSDPHQAP